MTKAQKLGTNICILRKRKQVKQKDLAKKIEKSASYLCDIEKGRTLPSLKVIYQIAEALDTEVSDLFLD